LYVVLVYTKLKKGTSLGYKKQNSDLVNQSLMIFSPMQVASVMTIWNNMQPEYAANLWNEALNKRLGTEVFVSLSLLLP